MIHARDSGPGIADVPQAIADGYSTAGSLGGGLGTVHRLMDDVVINAASDAKPEVEIVATRWRGTSPSDHPTPPLAVGAATRAKPGQDHNGDAVLNEHGTGGTLVGVIDGLGHGQAAQEAAGKAQQFVQTHVGTPLANLFAGVEHVCRGTRGVVMLLARFAWETDQVTVARVVNSTLRVCQSTESRHLVRKWGVLGSNAPSPVLTEWGWPPAAVMGIHSDGLTSNWNCDEVALGEEHSVSETATEVLQSLSTQDGDATVLVIRRAN